MVAIRLALIAATAPAAAATVDVVTPPEVQQKLTELEWRGVPILSMIMALLAVWLVREVVGSRTGREKGDLYLTAFLMLVICGVIVSYEVTPIMALCYGGGLGASGYVVIDLLRKRVPGIFEAIFGGTALPGAQPSVPPAEAKVETDAKAEEPAAPAADPVADPVEVPEAEVGDEPEIIPPSVDK